MLNEMDHSLEARIHRFYGKHEPSKATAENVQKVAAAYKDKETELSDSLAKKYGEPLEPSREVSAS